PQIETRVLTDVLALPYGVEVYDLLTRWNPLRARQYALKPDNGRKVLIAGLGPAGFTLAHHLTMEGCTVVGIDGLKIEPLPDELLKHPIADHRTLLEPLEERTLYGFGGVAEYGITVRWDKNFLKLIQLSLARRGNFRAFGGVRFGGTLTLEDAWRLGFDHVALAAGSGLPRVLAIPGSLSRGMRQASDVLMALQLTGAYKEESLASLQVRLPALVIGGGLTAIDTATEVQAYYIKQVEKVLARVERLGEERVRAGLDEEHQRILDEFLAHGRAVREERARAKAAGEPPDFIPLLRRWGGVTVVYRRGINASPAYIRNHEEIQKALEEGIYYAEGLDPLRVEVDAFGHAEAMVFRKRRLRKGRWLDTDEEVRLPARSVFVAAGTVPNTIYEREHPGTFALDGVHFLPHVFHRGALQPVEANGHCKAPEFGPFTSYQREGRLVSFLGDTHPLFQGSVVKAIASAYRAYPHIMAAMEGLPLREDPGFLGKIQALLTPKVEAVGRAGQVTELWIKAPMAARRFRPGQFFRLQTFERTSPVVEGTRLQIPLQTVSGAGVEDEMVRLFIHPVPGPSRLAGRLEAGQSLVLMGPNGAPFPMKGETVLAVAGSWGAAVMLALGPALRAAGKRVLLLAAFRDARQVYHKEALEAGADQVIWLAAHPPLITPGRPQDLSIRGEDAVEALLGYGEGRWRPGDPSLGIPLGEVDQVLVMGSTGLLRAFQKALRGPLGKLLSRAGVLGTVGSPMQCMLKGVCAQCLQWQVDPDTGERTRAVFACAEQDQPLLWIDLDNLAARQAQNRLLDRIMALWLERLLNRTP
ncbi:MAG: pyridine nucleotide-disulfide oxidoreductase, partial [Gammaproteobacteria bacterium]